MKRKDTSRAAVILTAATLATLIVVPVTGSAANLSGSSFAVKAVNREEAAKHFAIRPLFSGTPAPTAPPTTDPTAPPTTTPPTTTPTAPPTATPPPAPTDATEFTWAIESDGTARLRTLRLGSGVTEVVIPDSVVLSGNPGGAGVLGAGGTLRTVTAVEGQAFSSKGLTSVSIPDTVRSIGSYAFSGNKLTSIKIPSSLTVIDASVFSDNLLSSVTIPDTVKTIGNNAFYRNKLTSVSIGSSVTSIGIFAFDYNSLTSVALPESLTALGAYAFADNLLTSVTIPSKIVTIAESAFRTNKLTSVTLPANLKKIDLNAFLVNPTLAEVTIPSGVTFIGVNSFDGNIKRVYMEGSAPATFTAAGTSGSFGAATGKVVYYKVGATGYSNPWKGYTAATY